MDTDTIKTTCVEIPAVEIPAVEIPAVEIPDMDTSIDDIDIDHTLWRTVEDVELSMSETKIEMSSNMNNIAIITYNDVMWLLCLTMLIYDYGTTIPHVPNDTIKNCVNRYHNTDNLQTSVAKQEAMTHLSQLYSDEKITDFISDPDTDLQVGITISDKTKRIVVVFRGSESSYDWFHDLNFIKKCIDKKNNVYVHNGFHTQLTRNNNHTRLTQKIVEMLNEHPDYEVYVSGHSLGGALSTLYGFMLSHQIKERVTIVSFASPRVGNSGWKKAFTAKDNLHHYRVTNHNDIITALPSILYYHVGDNIRLERNSKPSFLYNYSYSWWDYSICKCHSPSDHYCDEYYKYLLVNKW